MPGSAPARSRELDLRSVGIEDSVRSWLSRTCVASPLIASIGADSRSAARAVGLGGRAYSGELASVLELQCHGMLSLQFEVAPDVFLLLLQCQGLMDGCCGGRPLPSRRDRILGGLGPGERLELCSRTPFSQQLWLHLPFGLVSDTFQKSGRPQLAALLDNQWPDGMGFAVRPLLESLLSGSAELSDSSDPWWLHRLEASLFATLLQLVSQASAPPPAQPPVLPQPDLHDRAIAFMGEHLAEPLTLDAIARACACSPRSLQLSFRSHLEQTPMQLLRSLRLEAMREALLQGMSVSDAGSRVGLAVSGKLASLYRDRFGETPRDTSQRGRAVHPPAPDSAPAA
ncbi:MAG: helix-turn-helix domain-containing protein [Cyanobium sp.]